jgi:hypothetical protein
MNINMARFEKGNQAAATAKASKKAMAAMIRKRVEKEGDSLSTAEFTNLVNNFNDLVAKRKRRDRKKKSEGADVAQDDSSPSEFTAAQQRVLNDPITLQKLTGNGREHWEAVYRFENEAEAARKASQAKSEAKQISLECDHSWTDVLLDGKRYCTKCGQRA